MCRQDRLIPGKVWDATKSVGKIDADRVRAEQATRGARRYKVRLY